MNDKPIGFVAELTGVREVSILGTADLDFWANRLSGEGLIPAQEGRRAKLLIIAASARFKGIPFREVSVCVIVSQGGGASSKDASYLVQAFNSSRLFTFCERAFFSTPYRHADVRVSTNPVSIGIAMGGELIFRAEMVTRGSSPAREPTSCGPAGWDGPVFLPGDRRREISSGKLFHARIRGETRTYPFRPSEDSLTIKPASADNVLRSLADSEFVPREWIVREDAFHAKSKTVKRVVR